MQNEIRFTTGSLTLTDANIYGGVTYTHDLNDGEDLKIGVVTSASVKFKTDSLGSDAIGKSFYYYKKQRSDSSFVRVGLFTVTDAVKQGNKFEITAYDNVSKLDKNVDEWLNVVTYPLALKAFYTSLLTYCGLSTEDTTFTNSTFLVRDNFSSTNMTGRVIMQYIAEVAAANVIAKDDGNITLKYYSVDSSKTITNAMYTKIEASDYQVPKIDKVWVGMEDGDIGVVAGIGDNELKITYNPILFTDTPSQIQSAVNNIYTKVNSYPVYTSLKVSMFEDKGISVGDCITVNGILTLVMSKEISASGTTFESKGNIYRSNENNLTNAEINGLRGKYNVLKRDVEQTMSEVGDLSAGLTRITQTATGIEAVVEGNATYYSQSYTPSGAHTGDIWKNTSNNKYYQYDGTQWNEITAAEAGNLRVINSIYQTLDGVIYDNGHGTTVINGSNITTGTIQAERLNLSGAITWGDLTQDVKNRIETGDIPAYIKSTYIDFTQVASPYIKGNDIEMYGGSFTIKNISGSRTYGFMGYGTGEDGAGNITDGVVLAYSDNVDLDEGDYYIICTQRGVRMQAAQNALYVTSGGIYKKENGVSSRIGVCVFA